MALSEDDKIWIKQALAETITTEIERLEIKLPTLFHFWASPVDLRLQAHSAMLRALDVEQKALRR